MGSIDELRTTFFQEAEDLLEGLADGLQELTDGGSDLELVNSIFRAVHSIKGGAGAFALDEVVRFAHRYENVLDAMRNGNLDASMQVLDVLTRAADHLTSLVEAARDELPENTALSDELLNELGSLSGAPEEKESKAELEFAVTALDLDDLSGPISSDLAFNISFSPGAELYSNGSEAAFLIRDVVSLGDAEVTCKTDDLPDFADLDPNGAYLDWFIALKTEASEAAVKEVFEFVEGLCELHIEEEVSAPTLPDLAAPDLPEPEPVPAVVEAEAPPEKKAPTPSSTPAAAEQKPEKKGGGGQATTTIRVELNRIDRLINLVGELVINQAVLAQCIKRAELSQDSDIDLGLEELRTLTRQIQDSVMATRAQPVKTLFQRMSRIAREAAVDVGKTLRVETEGQATEIDKTVIEKLADPLTHMIRNAVDHGLESAEKRTEAGKDPIGTISLSAAHQSGRVVIEIGDNGAGINREVVKAKAVEKGLIAPDAQLTPNEIDNLIFAPGFSTASAISNLSGRGVGMDVVKKSIQSLGGRVTIASETGKGSTFTIILPLTLAVLDGMVVGVAEETFVVPISAIVETMRLDPNQIFRLGTDNCVVRIRGAYVPVVDVGHALGYRHRLDSYESCVCLLIETADAMRAALMIDEIYDQRQVVIKGLEENYGHVHGVAAATILGDGRIALILDPSAIVGATGVDQMSMTLAAAE